MFDQVQIIFEIPEIAGKYISLFLHEEECTAIVRMGRNTFSHDDLIRLLDGISADSEALISRAYSRGVFDKVAVGDRICMKVAGFYRRLAFFAQYEPDLWKQIPAEARHAMDEWYVNAYAEGALPRLEHALKNEGELIENAYFFTLQETFDLIDSLPSDPYVVPCNCKSVALNCEKPRNVCIGYNRDINSQWDRGHGTSLTKEEAKELVRYANKNGLMQTAEEGMDICNCDGCCCYPIRASKRIGSAGLWPKRRYDIIWDSSKCINCGKCAFICNFGAFKIADKKVSYDETACWGCTICENHCPVKAISLRKSKARGAKHVNGN